VRRAPRRAHASIWRVRTHSRARARARTSLQTRFENVKRERRNPADYTCRRTRDEWCPGAVGRRKRTRIVIVIVIVYNRVWVVVVVRWGWVYRRGSEEAQRAFVLLD
jgi:hypothetical protein